jgi:hypothetical protein
VVTHDPQMGERARRRIRLIDGRVVADETQPGASTAPPTPPPEGKAA